MERFFTQTAWQDIAFQELGMPLDPPVPARADFYKAC